MIERPFGDDYDFEYLRRVLMRETEDGPVPVFEPHVDPEMMSEVTGMEFPTERWLELTNLSS
jgi:hypothetical protein